MNIVLNIGAAAVGWVFPQVQPVMAAYRYGRTAVKVAQVAAGVFTGNWLAMGQGVYSLASAQTEADCMERYNWCMSLEDNGIMGDGGTGLWQASCWAEYLRCISSC